VLGAGAAGAGAATVRPRKTVRISTADVEARDAKRASGAAKIRQGYAQGTYTRNYKGMARATAAEDALKQTQQGVRILASSARADQKVERVKRTGKQVKAARTKSGAVAALLGTAAVANEKHRKSKGQRPYSHWYD
jgi:hypothetical protein